LRVEFNPSFEDYLESRGELRGVLDDPGTPLYIPHVFLILLACVALVSWKWISAAIVSLGLLIFFVALSARNFFRHRAKTQHLNTLRADFERFSSGPQSVGPAAPALRTSRKAFLCKFGFEDKSWQQIPHVYPGVWATENTSGPNRLVIAPASRHVDLLLAMSERMGEPFSLLYILVAPHGAAREGRYETPHFLPRDEIVLFLNRFGPFLESDGRHHFWMRSIGESDLLVYDNHNLIYAYGCLDRFKEVLKAEGLAEVPKVVLPYPHTHFFHFEFDTEQDELLSFWNWERSALQDEDE
jgi:hypothetical protein